jgi:CRP/FNR family transcriptional regulator
MNLPSTYTSQFEPDLINEIQQVAIYKELPEGTDLIEPGNFIRSMPLLIEGSIKILRPDEEGEELLLYYLEKGDTCAMTLNCCMGNARSEIHAIAETDVELLMIPVQKMEEWSSRFKTWRNFVFNSYHNRMMEMLETIDLIAFNNMDERLEKYLEEKQNILQSQKIPVTHREIANDLHTSRVVISRLLKKMENKGMVQLHRSYIELR